VAQVLASRWLARTYAIFTLTEWHSGRESFSVAPRTSYAVATCSVPGSVFVRTVVTQSLVRLRKWG
jgi:hypothetical protein